MRHRAWRPFIALLLAGCAERAAEPAGGATALHARDVVRAAQQAAEADSSVAYGKRWRDRAGRDRLAALGLATLARLTYDYAEADRRYQQLVAADSGDAIAAYALLGRGLSAAQRWQRPEGIRYFERAARAARAVRDSLAEAESLLGLARFLGRGGQADSAAALLARARVLSRRDPALSAPLGCAEAPLAARGSFVRADSLIEVALAGTDDLRSRAGCLLVRATLLELRGRQDSAGRAADAALALSGRAHDYGTMAASAQFLAYLSTQYGARFDLGRKAALEAIAYGERSGNTLAIGWARLNLAQVAIRLGDAQDAVRQAEQARSVLEPLADLPGLVALRIIEGDAESLMARRDRARQRYSLADSLYARAGFESARPTVLYKLAALESAAGRLAEADSALQRGHAIAVRLGQAGRAGADHHYLRGLLALRRGQAEVAAAAFQVYLTNFRASSPHYLFDGRMRLAEALALAGRFDEAEHTLQQGLADLDRARGFLGDREARIAVLQSRRFEFDPDLGIATLVNALARNGRVETAFQLAEAQRARHLWEQVARRGALAGTLDSTAARVSRLLAAPLELAAVRAHMPDSTAILEFSTGHGGEPTTAFVIQPAGVATVTMPPGDSVIADIVRFASALQGGVRARKLGRSLAARLLDPVLPLLGADIARLVIVPDGPLHRLPFDALPLPDDRYLIERFTATLSPSSRMAMRFWTAGPPRVDGTMVAFGDPRFEARAGLPRLAASADEVRAAARHAKAATLLLGREATEDALAATNWNDVSVLHLATHARVEDHAVLSSALYLGPGQQHDGRIGPEEIAALRLNADLVVLSACRTVGGAVVSGEGLQGLTAPFLEAGARAVVATYWPIGDRSLVPVVDSFYAALARRSTAADALRSARLAALRQGASPAVWAALSITGDTHARPRIRWASAK